MYLMPYNLIFEFQASVKGHCLVHNVEMESKVPKNRDLFSEMDGYEVAVTSDVTKRMANVGY